MEESEGARHDGKPARARRSAGGHLPKVSCCCSGVDNWTNRFASCREIARRFPSLRQLDQQPLDPSIAFVSSKSAAEAILTPGLSPAAKRDISKGKREPIVFPVSVTGSFFESEGTRDFVAGFLTK